MNRNTNSTTAEAATVHMIEVRLSNAQHHKFYRGFAIGSTAVFQWGRIGANGQTSYRDYESATAALWAVEAQLDRKIRDGYTSKQERTSICVDPWTAPQWTGVDCSAFWDGWETSGDVEVFDPDDLSRFGDDD